MADTPSWVNGDEDNALLQPTIKADKSPLPEVAEKGSKKQKRTFTQTSVSWTNVYDGMLKALRLEAIQITGDVTVNNGLIFRAAFQALAKVPKKELERIIRDVQQERENQ